MEIINHTGDSHFHELSKLSAERKVTVTLTQKQNWLEMKIPASFVYLAFAFALGAVLRLALGLSADFPFFPFTMVSSTKDFSNNSLSIGSLPVAAARMISMHCLPVISFLSSNAWATA